MLQRSRTTIPNPASCPPWCSTHELSQRWHWDGTHHYGDARQAEGSRVCSKGLGQVVDMVAERVDVGLARFEPFNTIEGTHDLMPPRVVVWGQLHMPIGQARQPVSWAADFSRVRQRWGPPSADPTSDTSDS